VFVAVPSVLAELMFAICEVVVAAVAEMANSIAPAAARVRARRVKAGMDLLIASHKIHWVVSYYLWLLLRFARAW
jgi:hypothetical protein